MSPPAAKPLPAAVALLGLVLPEGFAGLFLHQLQDLLPRDDAAALGPGGVFGAHLPHLLGMLRREVVRLGAVRIHVVELPRAGVVADELPLADAHGGVALMLPEQRPALGAVRRE